MWNFRAHLFLAFAFNWLAARGLSPFRLFRDLPLRSLKSGSFPPSLLCSLRNFTFGFDSDDGDGLDLPFCFLGLSSSNFMVDAGFNPFAPGAFLFFFLSGSVSRLWLSV